MVWFEERFTEEDLQRVTRVQVTPAITAGTAVTLLEAIDLFTQEYVIPITTDRQTADRDKVIVGLFYRSLGFVKSAIALTSVVHQQSITSAERSVLELYIDIELLHRKVIEHDVTKILTFVDWQKLKAARRVDSLYAKYPDLDQTEANPHRHFIENQAALIEQKASILWGFEPHGRMRNRLDHWSARSLPDRGVLLGREFEKLVIDGYDMRNFSVHTGLAGVMGLERAAFEMIASRSLHGIAVYMQGELRVVGHEFQMQHHVPHYFKLLQELGTVRDCAFADQALRSRGEPARFFVHPGEPVVSH